MAENLKWYQRKTEIVWALVFAVLVFIIFEIFLSILKKYQVILDEFPLIKWGFFFIPWIALFVILYKYLKWRSKAKYYENTTNENTRLLEVAQAQVPTLTAEVTAKSQELSEAQSKIELMHKWEGIETTTGLDKYIKKLEGSGHHPRELIDNIERKLDFMGHGASKWTENRQKLTKMLENIAFNDQGGKARFLVINPLQSGLEEQRKQKIARSLRTLSELKTQHPNSLEVKVYNHIPQLRLTFYDDNLVVVGHYQGKERQDSSNTPLLVFLRKCDWSFYKAFLSHFEEEWNRATDLANLDMDEIKRLASEA
jgi:hypothetical protein